MLAHPLELHVEKTTLYYMYMYVHVCACILQARLPVSVAFGRACFTLPFMAGFGANKNWLLSSTILIFACITACHHWKERAS